MSDAERVSMDESGDGGEPDIEDLMAELEALRSDLRTVTDRDVPLLKGTVRQLLAAEIDSIRELPPAGRRFAEQLSELETRVAALEGKIETVGSVKSVRTSKEEKFVAVLAYAENKASGSQSKVAISAQEVKGCAGVSRRYAYEVIEAMAERIEGVGMREPEDVETGSGTKHKNKALLVDCEAVHTGAGSVNSFTTGSSSTGGGQ